jgi:DNA topoisomerase-3
LPTPTGIQLIDTIQNDLVKSAELTGSWEKQLKDIEKPAVGSFINNMKRMVATLVDLVKAGKLIFAGSAPKEVAKVEKRK